jgi:hypothetical protein
MASGTFSIAANIGGVSINKQITRTADSQASWEVTLPAGKDVTAWVKTDANTAACNLPSGHGYTDGNFDVYWSGGVRYGVPGTISTNALSLDGGTGTDFPASATSGVVVTKQVAVNVAIDGDNAKLFILSLELASQTATTQGHVVFEDSADDDIYALTLVANIPVPFDLESGIANPITGDPITECLATNGSSTAAATLKIGVLQDSTP